MLGFAFIFYGSEDSVNDQSREEEIAHPDRGLDLSSAHNVRDLGGYSTVDGGVTRWGRFVHSGDMDKLSEADQQRLIDYGIGAVIDLRMANEVAEFPNVFAEARTVSFHIHDFWGDRFVGYRSTSRGAPPEVKLADLYCSGLDKSGFVMAEIMTTIADGGDAGFAYHCRSGKDRTGLVSALLLAIAGVPSETICADYALTASFLPPPEKPRDPNAPGAYLMGCDPRTMAQVLGFLEDKYSGALGYLGAIGIGERQIGRIREKLRD